MLKTLLSSTCLALVFQLPIGLLGAVSTFETSGVAHARQSDEHKGSWVGFDFDDEDDDDNSCDADDGPDDGIEGPDELDAGDDESEDCDDGGPDDGL